MSGNEEQTSEHTVPNAQKCSIFYCNTTVTAENCMIVLMQKYLKI